VGGDGVVNIINRLQNCSPPVCERVDFTRTWKTLKWPRHTTKRGTFRAIKPTCPATFYWHACTMYHARKVNCHVYVCLASVSTIFDYILELFWQCGSIIFFNYKILVQDKQDMIQRNWQLRLHSTKKNKPKTRRNMCWTTLYTNKHK